MGRRIPGVFAALLALSASFRASCTPAPLPPAATRLESDDVAERNEAFRILLSDALAGRLDLFGPEAPAPGDEAGLELARAWVALKRKVATERLRNVLAGAFKGQFGHERAIDDLFRGVPFEGGEPIPASNLPRLAVIERFSIPGVAEAISLFLEDPDPGYRHAAFRSLETLKSGVLPELARSSVARFLASEDPRERIYAVSILAKQGVAGDAKRIAPLLKDPDVNVRVRALDGLVVMKAKAHADRIAKSLGDDAPQVRGHAATALAALGARAHAGKIASLLSFPEDPRDAEATAADPGMRMRALEALGELRVESTLPQIAPLLDDSNPKIRYQAALTMERFAGEKWTTFLSPNPRKGLSREWDEAVKVIEAAKAWWKARGGEAASHSE